MNNLNFRNTIASYGLPDCLIARLPGFRLILHRKRRRSRHQLWMNGVVKMHHTPLWDITCDRYNLYGKPLSVVEP